MKLLQVIMLTLFTATSTVQNAVPPKLTMGDSELALTGRCDDEQGEPLTGNTWGTDSGDYEREQD